MRLIAASAVLPTKFDTNNPSTTLYIDVNIIIIIDGYTNFKSFLNVKCSDNWIPIIYLRSHLLSLLIYCDCQKQK